MNNGIQRREAATDQKIGLHQSCYRALYSQTFYYPAPKNIGNGALISIDFFVSFFVYLFISLSARLQDKKAVLSQR